MINLKRIFAWLLVWYLVWLIIFIAGENFSLILPLLFGLLAIVALYFFRGEWGKYVGAKTGKSFLVYFTLLIGLLILISLYLGFGVGEVFTKLLEVLMQQILIVSLFAIVGRVKNNKLGIFVLVFFLAHIPLLILGEIGFALQFIVPALVGGAIFYTILERVKNGAVLTYLVHYGFYLWVSVLG